MSSMMRLATRSPFLAFAVMLSATATGLCAAANAPASAPAAVAAQQPTEKLDELDEVWVRGRHLSDVIEKAEDEFFKAYNKVNKNHDYDVHCGDMALRRESMVMARTCIPGFIVYNYYDLAGRAVSYGSQCSGEISATATNSSSCLDTAYVGYQLPPQELLAAEHRERYKKNVLLVIASNPRLQKMAANLAGLYSEMELVKNHYVKIKGASDPMQRTWKRRAASTNAGPHAL